MSKYLDVRAMMLVKIAAENLPGNPEKAKAILAAALADTKASATMDLLGGDLYEFMEEKQKEKSEQSTPQEMAEDASDYTEPDLSTPDEVMEDKASEAASEESLSALGDEINEEKARNAEVFERVMGKQDRTLLLKVAAAARKKGKMGLADKVEASVSKDLVPILHQIISLDNFLYGSQEGTRLKAICSSVISDFNQDRKAASNLAVALCQQIMERLDLESNIESALYVALSTLASRIQNDAIT